MNAEAKNQITSEMTRAFLVSGDDFHPYGRERGKDMRRDGHVLRPGVDQIAYGGEATLQCLDNIHQGSGEWWNIEYFNAKCDHSTSVSVDFAYRPSAIILTRRSAMRPGMVYWGQSQNSAPKH
ncbi:MAG: hypothetical protein GYB25_13745 [Rhodobacteraceae bacterium]|nr:hypothetical protein [Paracoccaceae bacterium]